MTATNHALTGAAIAILVKRPELAIPLAFLSHFALDAIPHYNPAGMTCYKFKNYSDSWLRKLKDHWFRIIFPVDMFLFLCVLACTFLLAPANVSPWTVFFSAVAGAAPDFDGGIRFLLSLAGLRPKGRSDNNRFSRFHIWLQWMERPWGIYIELVWLVLLLALVSGLIT